MKEPDGHQKAIHTEPSDVFKLAAAYAIKHTCKDHKRKATTATKLECKKHDIVQLQ